MLDKVKSAIPLNWALLSNPVNWVIVFLMVSIASLALAAIFKPAGTTQEENI